MSTKVNQSAVVTAVDTNEDGSTTVTLTSRKVDNGVPSFHVAYTYPAGSTAAERYPLDTVWVAAIEINAPAQDQITSTASLSSASSGVTEQPGEPSTGIVPEAPSEATEAPAAPAAPVDLPGRSPSSVDIPARLSRPRHKRLMTPADTSGGRPQMAPTFRLTR